MRIAAACFLLLATVGGSLGASAAGVPAPASLRCEYRESPLGVDLPAPRLSWLFQSPERGARQTAWQVLVASSADRLATDRGDLWDSGRVASDQTTQIVYAGPPLRSAQAVFWKVRTWDQDGKVSAWSAPTSWTMGLLAASDWQAKWIGGDPAAVSLRLRREFVVRPGLRRAVAFVSGLGLYEMTLNGVRATDDLLTPGWTKYDRAVLYDTYDLTKALREGPNAIGLTLGNGMYHVEKKKGARYAKFNGSFGPQKAIAQLRLEYADGSVEAIVTDAQWRAAAGPITFTSIYGGESYDARLNQPGWDAPGFDAAKWEPAVVTTGPGGQLRGLSAGAPPVRAFQTFKPVKTTTLPGGAVVYDLGQNAAQIPRITVDGAPGSVVKIWPAELLKKDGSIDQVSTGAPVYLEFTLAGGGRETWSPRFYYGGYRYLQVECRPAKPDGERPTVDALESDAISTTSAPVGSFASSSELFNRIYTLVRWAQRSNMVSVLTDCPHRERLGWLEQNHLNGPALRFNFDLNAFFAKVMHDMADSQLANGLVPDIAPEFTVFGGGFRDSPEWGSAFLLVAWQQYEFAGDTELFERYYDAMKRYVDYLASKAKDQIVSHGLGDWYDIGPGRPGKSKLTPFGVTSTAIFFEDTRVLARIARILGKPDEAAEFDRRAEAIRVAFNARFFDAANGRYATGSQAANAMPLVAGIVEPKDRAAVLKSLIADVREKGLTAGDVGYRYLLRALADEGRSDVIFALNNQSDRPGYGYQLAHGATSLTEAWDAEPTSSQNHFMLGQINEWFFHDLAGIQGDPTGPGFRKIIIRPAVVKGLDWVKARYDSASGPISSAWKTAEGRVTMEVTIPPNATATIYVPTADPSSVTEGGVAAAKAPGVSSRPAAGDCAVFAVEAGSYLFTARLPAK